VPRVGTRHLGFIARVQSHDVTAVPRGRALAGHGRGVVAGPLLAPNRSTAEGDSISLRDVLLAARFEGWARLGRGGLSRCRVDMDVTGDGHAERVEVIDWSARG
jgi:hypothetical protein